VASFTLVREVKAPPETVFDVLTDHRRYAEITPIRRSELEREGEPAPNGVGAIRVLRSVGPPLREETIVYEPSRRFSYKLLSGAPLRDHVGTVALEPQGEGTKVTYAVRTHPTIPVVGGVAIALLFFFLQRDLGPALFLSCVFLLTYALARNRAGLAIAGFALLIAGFYIGYALDISSTLTARVAMWRSLWDNGARGGEQIAQAIWGLATGGVFGTGLGLGDTSYVPAGYTDLMLAAIGEELGFAGLLAVAVLFAIITTRGFEIARRAPDDYSFFLASVITLFQTLPVLVMGAGMLGLVPLTGVVTPFLSFGGSAMVANFVAGGAAINVLARAAGAKLVVVDVGVVGPELAVSSRVRAGTRDMTVEPAMTHEEVLAAISVGRNVVRGLVADGCDAIALGEMGIGNTTAASALVAALTGRRPAEVTGRGTGLDAGAVHHKVAVIEAALRLHQPGPDDPLGTLAAVGGLEIAALVGAMLTAAEARIPIILDGFISGAAALVAAGIAPNLAARLIASHRSAEPGHRVILEQLALEPLLDLDLRLGEGSGAALALPLIRSATLLLEEMATFDSAGISGRSE